MRKILFRGIKTCLYLVTALILIIIYISISQKCKFKRTVQLDYSRSKKFFMIQSLNSNEWSLLKTESNPILNGLIENNLTQKMPSAIIIGAAKCGTSTLIEFLGVHPSVAAKSNEIEYFSINYKKGDEWYRKQMPFSNPYQITIEKTPSYFIEDLSPQRVFKLNPKMKLILVLRDPVERAVSHYVHTKVNKGNPKVNYFQNRGLTDQQIFQKILYVRPGKIQEVYMQNVEILKHGLYYQHTQNWLKYFPLEQFLFINGEQLRNDPSVEIDKLQSFLNITPIIKREHFVYNKNKGFFCITNPSNSTQVKCLNEDKGRKHPVMNSSVLDDLRDYFRSSNENFFKLINQEPWWPI